MTLGRYLARLILIRLLLLLVGLTALMSILEFLADGDQVLAQSEAVLWPILRYSFLRLPDILSQMIPIATILSGLLTFTDLAYRNELTAMQVAGMSKPQLGCAIMPLALLIAAFQFAIADQALPRAVSELQVWGVGDYGAEAADDQGAMIWLRQGDDIVRIRRVDGAGDEMRGVTIFRRDPQGNFVERIEADAARYGSDGWRLHGVSRESANPLAVGAPERQSELVWPMDLEPSLLRLADAQPKDTSLADLLKIIARPDLGTRPVYRYKLWVHERIAGPATTGLLLLLTLALARPFHNRASRGLLLAAGIAVGFVFWTFDGLLLSFGELGLLPPQLAAWMPVLIFAITAWWILLHDERRRRVARPRDLDPAPTVSQLGRQEVGAAPDRSVALGSTGSRRWKT